MHISRQVKFRDLVKKDTLNLTCRNLQVNLNLCFFLHKYFYWTCKSILTMFPWQLWVTWICPLKLISLWIRQTKVKYFHSTCTCSWAIYHQSYREDCHNQLAHPCLYWLHPCWSWTPLLERCSIKHNLKYNMFRRTHKYKKL